MRAEALAGRFDARALRCARGWLLLTAAQAGLLALACTPALAADVPLPVPPPPPGANLLTGVGAASERIRASVLPPGGTTRDVERVDTAVDGDGNPASVQVEQRLTLTGRGDYLVVERGPVRRAVALGDSDPPTLKLGALLYAGFVPSGGRELAARLTLDPALEAARLPLVLALTFTPEGGGGPRTLPPGGAIPGAGRVGVTLTNLSGADIEVATADAPPGVLAPPLDQLLAASRAPGPRPPVPGEAGLPFALPAAGTAAAGSSIARVVAPLHVTGGVRLVDQAGAPLVGTALTGAGSVPEPGGGRIDTTLATSDPSPITLVASSAGRLEIDLTAVPALDPVPLQPPGGAASWSQWARRQPAAGERRAALTALVRAVGQAGRIRSVSPYLPAGLPGDVVTTFRYRVAAVSSAPAPGAAPLRRDPVALALAALAVALIATNVELLRRRL